MLGYDEKKSEPGSAENSQLKKQKNIYADKLVVTLTSKKQFEEFIKTGDKRLLLLFYNSEFGIPSLIMNKLQLVCASSDGETECGTIDVKELPELAKQYHSGQKPWVLIFENGSLRARYVAGIDSVDFLQTLFKNKTL